MSLVLVSRKAALLPPWLRNELWARARAVPSLDLRFAENKSLVDATTGRNLVTFTRASSGTYVDSQGVIRTATTNLLLRSEEFGTTWTANRVSVNSNVIPAPNGTITADGIIEDGTSGTHGIDQLFTATNGIKYTLSAWLKSNGKRWAFLQLSGDIWVESGGRPRVWVDLQDGVLGSSDRNSGVSISAAGNGWYRVSLTATANTSTASSVAINATTANGSFSSYTGDGTSGIYLWGAQLEQSSTVGEYIPTTSTINSAPRFDHDPITGESLGLLVEEQRTNSIRNNTMVGAVTGTPGTNPTNWSVATTRDGLTKEIVGTGTTNGITWIDVRWSGTTNASGAIVTQPESITAIVAANGQSWTASSWLAIVGGSLAGINQVAQRVTGRSAAGSLLEYTDTTFAVTNVLTRYTASRTMTNASTERVTNDIVFTYGNGAVIDITFRIGMPQLEQGAFATSVIPTTTAAATRSADVASISGSNYSSWANADQGTLFADFSPRANTTFGVIYQNNGAVNEALRMFYNGSVSNYAFSVRTGGVEQGSLGTLGAYASQGERIASAYALNNLAAVRNGGSVSVDTLAQLPVGMDRLEIGTTQAASYLNGTIRRLVYWGQRLPNNVLQAITQ